MGLFSDFIDGFLDLIYPTYCVVCGVSDCHWFCDQCRASISYLNPPFCARCGIPYPDGICPECRTATHSFHSAYSAAEYIPPLSDVIHKFKFGGNIVLADVLSDIMVQKYPGTSIGGCVDIAVAIPSVSSRSLERGFNQAEELASRLCLQIGLEYVPNALIKTRQTPHQVGLPEEKRKINLVDSFGVILPGSIADRTVLLIDDVMTTGSTLEEASKTLRDAGAKKVICYTLARSM